VRDNGHRRVPEPPHRMTGVIFSMLVMILEIGRHINAR
jgi:hypothetical protein